MVVQAMVDKRFSSADSSTMFSSGDGTRVHLATKSRVAWIGCRTDQNSGRRDVSRTRLGLPGRRQAGEHTLVKWQC